MTPSTRTCNRVTPTLSLLETCMAVSPTTVADWEGDKIETKGGVVSARTLLTVTVTAAEVAELPAASEATAVMLWGPLEAVAVFQDKEAGLVGLEIADPRFAPSILNCSDVTPTLSLFEAVSEMLPVTAPPVGEVIDTLGGVVSGALTVQLPNAFVQPDVPAELCAQR